MAVDVELFGSLKSDLLRRQTVILQNPITVDEFIKRLGLRDEEIGLIVINGAQKELDDLVPTTCRLCFFPPVSGGCTQCHFDERSEDAKRLHRNRDFSLRSK